MKISTLTRTISRTASAVVFLCAVSASAQTWQVVDTFEGGVPQGTWTSVGQTSVNTSDGYLDLRAGGGNATVTHSVNLPQTFASGTFTLSFDFYLPSGQRQNQAGFGIGGDSQAGLGSWGAIGNRNRFQTVNATIPQAMAKVPNWTSDIFGTTKQGVWYNVWLVYNLDATPNTVTAHTKKASDPMQAEYITVSPFEFNDTNNDDWSEITYMGFGVGLFDDGQNPDPVNLNPFDTLGLIADNIYVSAGENVTEKPTSIGADWIKVDTFAGGAPEASWMADDALATTFEGDSLFVTGTATNAGMYTALPIDSIRSAFTVTFDMLLPAGAGASNIQFAVVGEEQLALTESGLFGDSDRFITQPGQDPQPLVNFGQWPNTGGPDLLGGTVEDQWYHVWLVYDGSGKSVDFYAVPVSDPVESVTLPIEPAGSFALEKTYTNLGYFVIGTGIQPNGSGVKIDNLYQSKRMNITLSPTAGDFGAGGGGDPVSLWVDVPTIDGGFKQTGIGLINDEHYPYIWHLPTGGYFYIADENSNLDSIFGVDLTNDFWFWTRDSFSGWYYNISDPASGNMGWSVWTQ